MKSLKNFKPINPEGVNGTILTGCTIADLQGDAVCGCFIIDDPGHHCTDSCLTDGLTCEHNDP